VDIDEATFYRALQHIMGISMITFLSTQIPTICQLSSIATREKLHSSHSNLTFCSIEQDALWRRCVCLIIGLLQLLLKNISDMLGPRC
jgi:hypothetical protein